MSLIHYFQIHVDLPHRLEGFVAGSWNVGVVSLSACRFFCGFVRFLIAKDVFVLQYPFGFGLTENGLK
jgi:hypothetical protein